MNTFLTRPLVQKTLRVFFSYLLFALFAILGLEALVSLHTAIFKVSLMATTRIGVANAFYVWGGFLMLSIYAVGIVVLESLMNKTAKNGKMLSVGVRIFAVEAGVALIALLLPIVASWFL